MLNESDSPEIWGRRKPPTRLWLLDFLFPSCLDCTLRSPSGSSLFYILQMQVELIIKIQTPKRRKTCEQGLGRGAQSENHLRNPVMVFRVKYQRLNSIYCWAWLCQSVSLGECKDMFSCCFYLLSSSFRRWVWVGVNPCKCHQARNISIALSYQNSTARVCLRLHPTVGTSTLLSFFWPQANILRISGSYYMLSELRSSWIPYEVTLVHGD